MAARLTQKLVRGLPWAIGEALFNALYGVATVVVIGRFISPVEFGAASTATATVLLVEVVSGAGLQEAVVRSRSADTLVTDTAFVVAMTLALVGMAVCVPAGFLAAALFGDQRLVLLVIAASLTLPLNASAAVPAARLTRKMRSASLTKRVIGGKIFGLFVLSTAATLGLGAWSVVLAAVASSLGSLVTILMATNRWPHVRLVSQEARALLRFGLMISAENMLYTIATRAFSLLFGFIHGLAALGNFQLAFRLSYEVAALVQSSVARFGLSFFAEQERTAADIRASFLTGTQLVAAAATPLFAGIALVANDFIPLVFGPQWQDSIPFLQIIAISLAVVYQRILIGPALRAKGQQTILVSYNALAAVFALVACIATARMPAIFGVIGFALRQIVIAPFVALAAHRYLQVSFRKLAGKQFGPTAAAAIMAIAVIGFQLLLTGAAPAVRLAGSIMVGAISYSIALWVICPGVMTFAKSSLLRQKTSG